MAEQVDQYAVVLASLETVEKALKLTTRLIHGPHDDTLREAAAERLTSACYDLGYEVQSYRKKRLEAALVEAGFPKKS